MAIVEFVECNSEYRDNSDRMAQYKTIYIHIIYDICYQRKDRNTREHIEIVSGKQRLVCRLVVPKQYLAAMLRASIGPLPNGAR